MRVWVSSEVKRMTYECAIYEVKNLANDSFMPEIFKPSLKKIAETLEMEKFRLKANWITGSVSDICPVCSYHTPRGVVGGNFCPDCGTDMRGEE